MKRRLTFALTVLGATAVTTMMSGCSTSTDSPVPTGQDLMGTWVQSGQGYEKGELVTWSDQQVVIDGSNQQSFKGYKEYTREGEGTQRETINGVIGSDGTVLMVDDDGTFQGRLTSGTLIGQYSESGEDAAAINVEMSRQ